MFSLEDSQGDFVALYNYMKGDCGEMKVSLFYQIASTGQEVIASCCTMGRLRLDIKKIFLERLMHWNRLPKENPWRCSRSLEL